jgi:hypothetical protein
MKDKRKKEADKQKKGEIASEERWKKAEAKRRAEEMRKTDKKSDKARGSSSNSKRG